VPPPIVTIDGLAGVGKTTLANRIAAARGWNVLHQGLLYRALASLVHDEVEGQPSESDVWSVLDRHEIELRLDGTIRVDRRELAASLGTIHVTDLASRLAVEPWLRTALLPLQRAVVSPTRGLVAEGRDLGSAVFPEADPKIWLEAPARERERRIAASRGAPQRGLLHARDQREASGQGVSFSPASDAVVVRTQGLSGAEVADRVDELIDRALARR
jgi:cytidylate kinase